VAAHIHPDNTPSQAVAAHLGLMETGCSDDDGEAIWETVWPNHPAAH